MRDSGVDVGHVPWNLSGSGSPTASVLIVDDHPANLLAVESILSPLGLRLVMVPSGEDALRHLLKDEFALILLDVQMAGLDGLQTAALIKQNEATRYTPIIFLTAFTPNPDQIFAGYKEGAVDYLLKPFDPAALRAKVSVFVDLYLQSQLIKRQAAELVASARRFEQERVARAEAEAATRTREDVLAVVAHDLRNPLFAIAAAADTLLRTLPRSSSGMRQRQHTEIIQRSADRMNRLINDLLDVSRIEGGRLALQRLPHPTDLLVTQALETIRPLASSRGHRLEAEVAAGEAVVTCDLDRISQVLSNLLGNAVKFTPDGGKITLSTRMERGELLFAVADNGPGIAKDQLPHLFTRYWQARRADRDGIGLGLAIAKGIVEAHGGRIWAASTPGEGSTFSFALPTREVAADLARASW